MPRPIPTPEDLEHTVRGLLVRVRGQYAAAVSPGATGPAWMNAFGCEVRIDRIRKIVIPDPLHRSTVWDERGEVISNKSPLGRATLALYVGRGRHLSARDWVHVLHLMVRGDSHYMGSESSLCSFLDLAVVEPVASPDLELPIWTAVAHELAAGRLEDNLFARMPPLISDHDVLHAEIPASVRDHPPLAPDPRVAHRESLPGYMARLLAGVRPELAAQVARCTTDEERAALFRASEPELRAYVRTHLFARAWASQDDAPG